MAVEAAATSTATAAAAAAATAAAAAADVVAAMPLRAATMRDSCVAARAGLDHTAELQLLLLQGLLLVQQQRQETHLRMQQQLVRLQCLQRWQQMHSGRLHELKNLSKSQTAAHLL